MDKKVKKFEKYLQKCIDTQEVVKIYRDVTDGESTVECEYMKNPTFTIGPIIKVGDRSVEITYFDATGKLDKKPTKIKYKDISQVRFATRYTKVFKKYVFK